MPSSIVSRACLAACLVASLASLAACHNDDGPNNDGENPIPLPSNSIGGTVSGSTGALTLRTRR